MVFPSVANIKQGMGEALSMCCEIDIAPAASRVLYIYKLIHPNLNYSPHRTVLTELKVNPRDICLTKFK